MEEDTLAGFLNNLNNQLSAEKEEVLDLLAEIVNQTAKYAKGTNDPLELILYKSMDVLRKNGRSFPYKGKPVV